ncbi:hypothetical protein D8X55_02215 [Malacoplasma penetrans]|nr:hypothetical protein D8X55_02215 [Malacoplasma penetrans]
MMDQKRKVNLDELFEYQKELLKDSSFRVSQNALVNNKLEDVAIDFESLKKYNGEYTNNIKPASAKITHQKNSGRCWIFAALNMIRDKFIEDNNLENFEFSQSYLHFYDKLEKANVFLNHMVDMVDVDSTDRVLFSLLSEATGDGGFFDWAKNLILKYGLVPKSEMEDSFSSSNTLTINKLLDLKLKQAAIEIRKYKEDKSQIFQIREKYLYDVYKILVSAYGLPPKKFDLFLKDKKEKTKNFYGLTPLTFLKKIKFNFDDYVSIVYTPYRKIKPFQRYELTYANAMQEKGNAVFTTVDQATFRLMALSMMYKKKSIWFACDVDHFSSRQKGIWATDLYDFENFFNIKFNKDISQHIEYSQIGSNHAMTLQGFDLNTKSWEKVKSDYFAKNKSKKLSIDDFKSLVNLIPIKKWNIENSWGEKFGNKGIFTISDDWFNNYVYEIVLSKFLFKEFLKNPEFLSKTEFAKFKSSSSQNKTDFLYEQMLSNALATKPIKLALWEPFNKFMKGVK